MITNRKLKASFTLILRLVGLTWLMSRDNNKMQKNSISEQHSECFNESTFRLVVVMYPDDDTIET